MVSEYQYASQTNVENFTGLDYSEIDAERLSDTRVDKKITIAERIINGYIRTRKRK